MAAHEILIYAVLPLWMAAGFADYFCHRASNMTEASGAREAILHWIGFSEVGVAFLVIVFLKLNALTLAALIFLGIAHEITIHFDLALGSRTRIVTVWEQHLHSFLEVLPITVLLLVFIMHWPQTQALFGVGSERADFSLALGDAPPWRSLGVLLAAFTIFAIIPYGDELRRGLRAQARKNAGL
jgi:hypothetical protein